MKLALRAVLVLLLLTPAGCVSAPPAPVLAATDEKPRCTEDALWLEGLANKELARAYRADERTIRRKYFDRAMNRLRDARALYDAELEALESDATKERQVPIGRREALELEINRLSRQMLSVVKDRPSY
ncbi:hypothetical protein HY251_22430 [bacterium]|nr:hypothetical protein [bacterium]